jgi:hypothetical protein
MKAKVWNDNKYVYTDTLNGDKVTIPAGEFIEMDYMDAVLLKGKIPKVKFDSGGLPMPESYQMLRVEQIKDDAKTVAANAAALDVTCQACSYKAADQVDLAKHILDNHVDNIAEKSRDEAGRKLQEALKQKR